MGHVHIRTMSLLLATIIINCMIRLCASEPVVREKCEINIRKLSGFNEKAEYNPGSRLNFTFKYESKCSSQTFFNFTRQLNGQTTTDNVHSDRYRIDEKLTFLTTSQHEDKDTYFVSLIIAKLSYPYQGTYKLVVYDKSDTTAMQEHSFAVNIEEHLVPTLPPPCFLPLIKNITAKPAGLISNENTMQSIHVHWQVTEREDTNVPYCTNSKRWKITILTYADLDNSPLDKEVVETLPESSVWTKVHGRNTNHTFTGSFSKNMYYLFQVGHLGKNFSSFIDPSIFASNLYYFGNQAPAAIVKSGSSVIRLEVGTSRSVSCVASGYPYPYVEWSKKDNESPFFNVHTMNVNVSVLELKNVTSKDAGTYHCLATNYLVNPPEGRHLQIDAWEIKVIVEDYHDSSLSCRLMEIDASVCKIYIQNSLEVYTNKTLHGEPNNREEKAKEMDASIRYNIPIGKCRDLALSMMCHSVYPYCNPAPGKPTPRKMCKRACDEFLTGECKDYMPQNNSVLRDILVSGCDERDITGGDSPECIPVSLTSYRNGQIESIEDTGDCYRDSGRGYRGNTYRTQSGALCQSWTEQSPHSHPMLPDIYKADLEQAHFSCRNPGGIGERPWCYTGDPTLRWEYCDIPKCDSCERYTGQTCRDLDGYASMNVTVRRTKNLQSQNEIEDKISLFAKSILFHQPSVGCQDILVMLLCHHAFPQCKQKQLCSIHCGFEQALKDHCPDVYNDFSQFKQSNSHLLSVADCNSNDSQCMPVTSISNISAVATQEHGGDYNATEDGCYKGHGRLYKGTLSTTIGGIPCQEWDSPSPHSHPITSERYPELRNSKNYCRNPGELKQKPWCYTNSSEKVWDYCNIRHCDDVKEEVKQPNLHENNHQPNTQHHVTSNGTSGPIIGVMSVTVAILLILMGVAFTGCYLFMRHKNRRAKAILETEFRLSKMTREAFEGEKYVTNTDYTKVRATNRSQSLVIPENFRLLNSKDIKYVSQLGQGNFGIVFKGKAFGIKEGEDEEGIDVAVKTLKEEATSEVKQDFIDEAKLMFTFDHPNILTIHGVCMTEMPYQLVFEYMDEGDLTKFLRSRASSQQKRLVNPFAYRSRTESSFSNDPASLTKTELLYICKQVADGMNYLAENNHVHRDLACRNCLIKSDLVVKIGDFGMSRNLYSKDYYRINGSAVLPVRWMSPESLIYGKFSIEADVWSFGVVMWEVFSFALQPYYGISNEEVTEAIRRGKTLNRPDNCPIEIYRIMKECWTMNPADRITFSELYESLSALHQMASLCGSVGDKFADDDDAFSDSSDMPSDAFYSEEHLDTISNELEQNL